MIKKIGADSFYITAASIISKISILLLNLLIAQFSSAEVYGRFALIRSTINLVETAFSSSVNPVVIRASAEAYKEQRSFPSVNTFLLIMGLFTALSICLMFLLVMPKFSSSLFAGEGSRYVILAAALLFFTNANGFSTSFLVTGRISRLMPISSIVAASVSTTLGYFLIYKDPVYWVLVSLILLHLVDFSLKIVLSSAKGVISLTSVELVSKKTFSILRHSLSILFLSSAINAFSFWLLRVILVDGGNNFSALAIFDVSFQYIAVEMMVINNIVTVVQGRYFSSGSSRNYKDSTKNFSPFLLICLAVLLSVMANLIFADFLVGLYGKEYDPNVLRSLSAVLPFYAYSVYMNRFFVSCDKPRVILNVAVISSIFAVAVGYGLMQTEYGLANCFLIYFVSSTMIYIFSRSATAP